MPGSAPRTALVLLWLLAACGAIAQPAHAEVNVADPGTFVVDQANVIDQATRQHIEAYLKELEQKTTAQVKLLTVPTSDGEEIASFAQRQFDHWKLGQKGKDNGALIVLALKERQARIHTGYGLEGALPDGWEGSLLRKVRDQYFRGGNYSQGLHDLAVAVANKVADEQGVKLDGVPAVRHAEERDHSSTVVLALCVLGIVIWLYIQRRRYYRRVWRGNLSERGFWASLAHEMARNSSGSNWSGGSFGGGFGGGSGGGGSFGGGGSSGGGGASTSW